MDGEKKKAKSQYRDRHILPSHRGPHVMALPQGRKRLSGKLGAPKELETALRVPMEGLGFRGYLAEVLNVHLMFASHATPPSISWPDNTRQSVLHPQSPSPPYSTQIPARTGTGPLAPRPLAHDCPCLAAHLVDRTAPPHHEKQDRTEGGAGWVRHPIPRRVRHVSAYTNHGPTARGKGHDTQVLTCLPTMTTSAVHKPLASHTGPARTCDIPSSLQPAT